MSNSMLEQAIIDAEALKEAAVKNAEQAIIEKYSADIKDAVNQLLEQEDPMILGDEEPEEETDFQKSVPDAHTEEENLCPCPDEDEEVEIDFDELAKRIEAEEEEMSSDDMMDREEVADEELEGLQEVLSEILSDTEEIEISEEKKQAEPEKVHYLEPEIYQDKANSNTPNTRTTFYG